jgi:hypothetical protein
VAVQQVNLDLMAVALVVLKEQQILVAVAAETNKVEALGQVDLD